MAPHSTPPPTLTKLTSKDCDEIFSPVLGSVVAIFMTETMMRTSALQRQRDPLMIPHNHPERVSTATVVNVLQNFKERYMDKGTGKAVRVAVDHTDQRRKLEGSLISSMIANLGTTCFGYVFERYLNLTNKFSDECEHAFGLEKKAQWDDFKQAFPSAHSYLPWQPTGTNWLSRMIRNSFAHAGWKIKDSDPPRIALWNWSERQRRRTFHISMDVADLANLIYGALERFISKIESSPSTSSSPSSLSHHVVVRFIKKNQEDHAIEEIVRIGGYH